MAASERKRLIAKLDALARDLLMRQAGTQRVHGNTGSYWGPCEHCGKYGMLDVAHFASRRILALRWSFAHRNLFALTKGHHAFWAHHKPSEFAAWVEQKIGAADYAKIRMILKTPRRPDLKAIRLMLEAELKRGTKTRV